MNNTQRLSSRFPGTHDVSLRSKRAQLLLNDVEVGVELAFKLYVSDRLLLDLRGFCEVPLPAPNTFERLGLILRGYTLGALLPGRGLLAELLNPLAHRDTILLHPGELCFCSTSCMLRFTNGGGHESFVVFKLPDHSLKA